MDERDHAILFDEEADAFERIARMRRIFKGLQDYLEVQVEEILPVTGDVPKSSAKKLEELQSLQVALMKAEEAFNEKFRPDDEDDIDFDALRDQIGRAIDRIRDAENAGIVPKKPERSAD